MQLCPKLCLRQFSRTSDCYASLGDPQRVTAVFPGRLAFYGIRLQSRMYEQLGQGSGSFMPNPSPASDVWTQRDVMSDAELASGLGKSWLGW